MVLDPDELKTCAFNHSSGGRGAIEVGRRVKVAAEFDLPQVIGHVALPDVRAAARRNNDLGPSLFLNARREAGPGTDLLKDPVG